MEAADGALDRWWEWLAVPLGSGRRWASHLTHGLVGWYRSDGTGREIAVRGGRSSSLLPMNGSAASADDIEARLDALQRDSKARHDELKAIAAALPEATSRRAYLTSMVRGIADAPDKPTVVKRTVVKLLRTPVDLFRPRSR